MYESKAEATPAETVFCSGAYERARAVLAQAEDDANLKCRAELARRGRLAAAVTITWLVVAVALVLGVGNDLLVVGEVGLAVAVCFDVFYLLPAVMARSNLDEVFAQYSAEIDLLEERKAPLPECSCIEELVPAMDFAAASIGGDELEDA